MDDLIKTIITNKRPIMIGIAVLMIIFFGLCPALDVLGKDQVNGIKYIIKGKDFISALMIIAPIAIIAVNLSKEKATDNLNSLLLLIAFILGFVLSVSLPSGVSFAWGSWMYMITIVIGLAVCNVHRITNR